jgi:hypothetical protein
MADKGPYGKVRGGKMKEGCPELCRPGTMPSGNRELNRGNTSVPSNPELCRPGRMAATMRELGDFSTPSMVDRTAENERARVDIYGQPVNMIPGHKKMAGMP